MWHGDERPWRLHQPRFGADELDPERATGPWFGHRWFAYDLIRWGRPDAIVELGTHYGVSFFAFCQAVLDEGCPTHLHAVDTWEGEEHSGRYGEEVIETVERIRREAYGDLDVRLHRCFFSEALAAFPDESIDLLHIDGFHSYEAVREDFETWLPKVAPGGLVLFHDIAASSGYGSSRFWAEISDRFPARTFPHSFGLGVLAPKGADGHVLFDPEFDRWAQYYEHRAGSFLGERMAEAHARMIADRDEAIAAQARMVDEYADEVRAREATIAEQLAELDRVRRELAEERGELARILAEGLPHDRGLRSWSVPIAAAVARVEPLRVRASAARSAPKGAPLAPGPSNATERARRTVAHVLASSLGRFRSSVKTAFDPTFYLLNNPDVRRAGIDPLAHYLRYGWREQRDPSALFSTSWYFERYRDVVAAGVEPFRHYLAHGWREGRDPAPWFESEWYVERTPDAGASGVSPLEYYWTTGYANGDFVHPEQRRRVLALPRVATEPMRRVVSVRLIDPGRRERTVSLDDLVHADVDLVTLDLWDTMVARRRPADAGKLATARRMYLLHRRAMQREMSPWALMALRVEIEAKLAAESEHEEYAVGDVLTQVLIEVLGTPPDRARALAAPLAEAEIAEEVCTTYPVADVVAFLERVRARPQPPQVAVLSDFYFGEEALAAVLRDCGYGRDDLPVYSSSDRLASKRRGGALYDLVRRELDVPPERHLHIGDNPWSDGDGAVASGAWAAVVELSPTSFPGPGELDHEHVDGLVDFLARELSALVPALVPADLPDERTRRAAQAGVLTALLPVAVVAAAVEEAVARGVDHVHYASREGAFLARVHEAVAPALVGGDAPEAVHLEVSRRSTFGASVSELTRDELLRMWRQYPDQSPRALLTSLGVDAEDLHGEVAAAGLSLDTTVPAIADDGRVAALLARPAFRERVEVALRGQRQALLTYLEEMIGSGPGDVVLVDVGWRGTIQDNLARLLADRHLVGVYLGLFPYHNPQPDNATKIGVAIDGNEGDEFAFVDPPAAVEAPWTPDIPSVIAYTTDAAGRAEPVRDAEGPRAAPLIAAFQEAVVAAAPTVASWMVVNGLTASMLHASLGRALRDYYEAPPGGVADIWFGSTHDDTFGALNQTPYAKLRPPRSILADAAVAGAEVPYGETAEERESHWPAGYRAWLPMRALEVLRAMRGEQR